MGARTGLRALAGVTLLSVLYVVVALPLLLVEFVVGAVVDGTRFFTSGDVALWSLGVVSLVALLVELAGPRRLPAGLAVDEREQPVLWELVRDVADDLRVPVPDGIVLTGGPVCELRVVRRPGTWLRRHLVLGTVLPHTLTGRRLRVVIAHALGHSRRRRPPLADRIACHGVDAVAGFAEMCAGRGSAGTVTARFARFYERVCAPVVRFEERAADRAAARAYGTEALIDGLTELAVVRRDWALFRRERLDPGIVAGCVPADPIVGFRAFHAARVDADPDASDTGGLTERIERLRERPLEGREIAGGADADLGTPLRDPVGLLTHVRPYLLVTDDEGHVGPHGFAPLDGLVTLTDELFLGHVVAFAQARHAAALAISARRVGVEYPVTLGGVLALLAEGRGDALVAEHGPDTGIGLTALLGCAWADSGHGRLHAAWDGGITVFDHDGQERDPAAAAETALAGADGAARVRDRLRAA
ncbi:hypothetical protein GT354_47890, partial [Streptomyces sp. SID3343]|nr:hypothetical protein [Streptomyces sp. SID3343]